MKMGPYILKDPNVPWDPIGMFHTRPFKFSLINFIICVMGLNDFFLPAFNLAADDASG